MHQVTVVSTCQVCGKQYREQMTNENYDIAVMSIAVKFHNAGMSTRSSVCYDCMQKEKDQEAGK